MELDIKALYKAISHLGIERQLKSHEVLVDIGERSQNLYFIKAGGLLLNHVHPKTGKERSINFFTPDFHAVASVSHAYVFKEPSKYILKTFTRTTLLEVNGERLRQFLKGSIWAEPFEYFGIKSMIDKNELRAHLISLSSEEMLQYMREQYPQMLQQVPSKYIADFLGISPQWLSKLKRQM